MTPTHCNNNKVRSSNNSEMNGAIYTSIIYEYYRQKLGQIVRGLAKLETETVMLAKGASQHAKKLALCSTM